MPAKIVKASLNINEVADGRNTANFEVRARRGTWTPAIGNDVVVLDEDGLRAFGGTIDDIDETTWPAHQQSAFMVRCVGYDQILDRRRVARAYENVTLREIVLDLWADFLDAEGITLGTVDTGPAFSVVVFPYLTLYQCFAKLTELSGYQIAISRYKVLSARAFGSVPAPFTIDTSTPETAHCQSLTIRRHRELYRNRQYVRGGRALTDVRTEQFIGDGQNATFTLAFPVGQAPTITRRTITIVHTVTQSGLPLNPSITSVSSAGMSQLLGPSDFLEGQGIGVIITAVIAGEESLLSNPAGNTTGPGSQCVALWNHQGTAESYRLYFFDRAFGFDPHGGISAPRIRVFTHDNSTFDGLYDYDFSVTFPNWSSGQDFFTTTDGVVVVDTPQTVGVGGLDTDKQWYWNKDSQDISQGATDAKLSPQDTLIVAYQGLFPIVIQTQNDDEIEDRAAIEGGSGLYEDVDEDASLEGQLLITQKASALLARYGMLPVSADIVTTDTGLEVGQVLHIIASEYTLDAEFLIQSIDVQWFNGDRLVYHVQALAGENLDSWLSFFRRLLVGTSTLKFDANEPLLVSKHVGPVAAVLCGDSVVLTIGPAAGSFSVSPSRSVSPSSSKSPSASPSASQSPSASKSPSSSNSPSDSPSPGPLLFGRETFEGGTLPASFDSVANIFGAVAVTLDATSKINGTFCLKFVTTGEGGAAGIIDLGSESQALWLQCVLFLDTGFTFGASGFFTLMQILNAAQTNTVSVNIENYGVPKVVITGTDIAYTPTSVDLPLNTKVTLEVLILKHASAGRIMVWLNNPTEASPDYDSGAMNTGSAQLQTALFGVPYAPETISDVFVDDCAIGDAFIGNRS